MKNEVVHFTDTPDIQHFAEVKVSPNDNVYGVTWANLVMEYLKTAYSGEATQAEIVSFGVTYQVLRRAEVTVFYDAEGNTLFDVENKRLEKEYGFVMNAPAEIAEDEEKEQEESAGEPSATEQAADEEAPVKANAVDVNAQAMQKLENELKNAKDKTFADPVIKYLLGRCEEDSGLAEDVMQPHKTWSSCLGYIYNQAKKMAGKERQCAVRNDVVYEWAEDYYRSLDKPAQKEPEKKTAAPKKTPKFKTTSETSTKAKELSTAEKETAKCAGNVNGKVDGIKQEVSKKPEKKKSEPKKKEPEGQMSLFDFL